jgi:hypothetical protein
MLPIFLIQALVGLGGVCLVISITIFHYFKSRVDECVSQRVSAYFSSPTSQNLNKALRKGGLSLTIVKDLSKDLSKILEPNRRFRSLLFYFPMSGFTFILSATLAGLPSISSDFAPFTPALEIFSDSTLIISFGSLFYGVLQLVRLTQDLT